MRLITPALLAAGLFAAGSAAASHAAEARPLAPEAYLTGCEEVPELLKPTCQFSEEAFVESFERALDRSYWAQRDVALCLRTSCEGAVRVEPVAACAWRLVLAEGGFRRYSPGDRAELEADCDPLDAQRREAAQDKAETIVGHMEAAGALSRAE